MSEPVFRPRSATEILDASVRLYRAHFGPLVVLSAILLVPPAVLVALLPEDIGKLFELLGNLLYPIVQGGVAVAVDAALHGREVEVGAVFARLRGRMGSLVAGAIASGILTVFGFLLFIVPGVFLFAALFAVTVVIALEDTGGVGEAMSRSRELARGHTGHVLAVLALALLLLFALVIGIMLALGVLAALVSVPERVVGLVSAVVSAVLFPVTAVASTLLYYDLRVRKEAYDVEQMAAALG